MINVAYWGPTEVTVEEAVNMTAAFARAAKLRADMFAAERARRGLPEFLGTWELVDGQWGVVHSHN